MTQTFERSTAQSNISENSQPAYEYRYSGYVSYATLDSLGKRDPRFLEADIEIYPEDNTFRVITPEELAFNSFMNNVITPRIQQASRNEV